MGKKTREKRNDDMIVASLLVELLYVIIGSLLGCLIIGTIFGVPPHFSLIAGLLIAVLIVLVWLCMLWLSPSSLDPLPTNEESDEQQQDDNPEESLSLPYKSIVFEGYTSSIEE